jgi:hypothetical protein
MEAICSNIISSTFWRRCRGGTKKDWRLDFTFVRRPRGGGAVRREVRTYASTIVGSSKAWPSSSILAGIFEVSFLFNKCKSAFSLANVEFLSNRNVLV